jgi:outer membrane protein TolC
MNGVQSEVASAHARTHASFARIETAEEAVRTIREAFARDVTMIKGGVGRPIELMDSLRLLGRARLAYLAAIMDYNSAQVELYVALGQPPANALARPVPPDPGREPRADR